MGREVFIFEKINIISERERGVLGRERYLINYHLFVLSYIM